MTRMKCQIECWKESWTRATLENVDTLADETRDVCDVPDVTVYSENLPLLK